MAGNKLSMHSSCLQSLLSSAVAEASAFLHDTGLQSAP
jgi:hypothetical protein